MPKFGKSSICATTHLGQVLIGGQWRAARNAESLHLMNASDGSLLAEIASGNAADIDAAMAAAKPALDDPWD